MQAPLVMSVDLVQIGERTNIPYAPKIYDGILNYLVKERSFSEERIQSTLNRQG